MLNNILVSFTCCCAFLVYAFSLMAHIIRCASQDINKIKTGSYQIQKNAFDLTDLMQRCSAYSVLFGIIIF